MLQALVFSSESHSCLGSVNGVRGAVKPLLSVSDKVLLLEVALLLALFKTFGVLQALQFESH